MPGVTPRELQSRYHKCHRYHFLSASTSCSRQSRCPCRTPLLKELFSTKSWPLLRCIGGEFYAPRVGSAGHHTRSPGVVPSAPTITECQQTTTKLRPLRDCSGQSCVPLTSVTWMPRLLKVNVCCAASRAQSAHSRPRRPNPKPPLLLQMSLYNNNTVGVQQGHGNETNSNHPTTNHRCDGWLRQGVNWGTSALRRWA